MRQPACGTGALTLPQRTPLHTRSHTPATLKPSSHLYLNLPKTRYASRAPTMSPFYDPEDALLELPSSSAADEADTHALRTAPIVTSDALFHLGQGVIPQRAVYGRLVAQHAPGFPTQCRADRKGKGGAGKVYVNTNAPFSALVCGVQVRVSSNKLERRLMHVVVAQRAQARATQRPSSLRVVW